MRNVHTVHMQYKRDSVTVLLCNGQKRFVSMIVDCVVRVEVRIAADKSEIRMQLFINSNTSAIVILVEYVQ